MYLHYKQVAMTQPALLKITLSITTVLKGPSEANVLNKYVTRHLMRPIAETANLIYKSKINQ